LKYPGAFITFEGLDGCGKSSQIELEAERLRRQQLAVTVTREPGGTSLGRRIREIVLKSVSVPIWGEAELTLMFAARSQHIEEVIRPSLQSGSIVLCDRFTDSTVAYQGYGRSIPLDTIQALDNLLSHGVRPDLTLLLDIDPETAMQRTLSRNRAAHETETRFEEEGLEFSRRVWQGYHEIAQREPQRVRIVDGRDSIAAVQGRVSGAVDEFLNTRGQSKNPGVAPILTPGS
jgi:dTMP kinase